MLTRPIQLSEVIYNAATQSFEALVTVYSGDTARRYPCAINAPITMSFDDAATGLTRQALRRHRSNSAEFAELRPHVPSQRAGRQGFDPKAWLESLVQKTDRRSA